MISFRGVVFQIPVFMVILEIHMNPQYIYTIYHYTKTESGVLHSGLKNITLMID